MFLIPAAIHNKLIIRFTVTSQFTTPEDILRDWAIIRQTAGSILSREPRRLSISTPEVEYFSLQSVTPN